MFCINCFHANTQIKNSRPHKKRPSVWRRRHCVNCESSFTTLEQPSLTDNTPVWRTDGTKSSFNIGRLVISIADAFSHNPDQGKDQALRLAQTVEGLLSSDYAVISTDDIEAVAHQVLRRFDELAAIQYAAKHQLIVSAKRRGRPSIVLTAPRTQQSPSP